MNYRITAPTCYKDLTSKDIIAYFEDEDSTAADLNWFKKVLADNKTPNNPVSKFNWRKIKTEFAREYFPEIAPADRSHSDAPSVENRISALFGDI